MRRLVLVVALLLPLAACPEQRPPPPRERPPQGALSSGAGSLPDVITMKRPAGPEWFGLYLIGKKAGWSRSEVAREVRDGSDVLVARSETLIRATVGGKDVERRQDEERVYEARPGGRLLSFRASWSGDGGSRTVTGQCERGACKASLVAGASTEQRTIEDVRDTADLADGVRLAAARRSAVRGGQLDLDKLRVRELEHVFLRRERVAGAGVEEEVSIVSESEVGDRMAAEYKVADDGRIVEFRLGGAIVARPEGEDTARRFDRLDLFALSRVLLPRALPRDVPATIEYRLAGIPASFQKSDARQRFERGPRDTAVLTVNVRRPVASDPSKDTPLQQARAGASAEDLAATPQANADAPEIRKLAREIAGDAKGTYEVARRLSEHVYRTLDKAYGASHDRASDVLAAGKGDCTEHSVLLVALARSLGIPARSIHGLAFARYGDGQPALYWHAWVEVRSAGEWIAIDPTFGEPVADATHVALGRGTQVDTIGLLGSLRVLGVDVKPVK